MRIPVSGICHVNHLEGLPKVHMAPNLVERLTSLPAKFSFENVDFSFVLFTERNYESYDSIWQHLDGPRRIVLSGKTIDQIPRTHSGRLVFADLESSR